MESNNSKLILAVAAAAVVAVGIYAVRNLTGPGSEDRIEVADTRKSDAEASSPDTGDKQATISSKPATNGTRGSSGARSSERTFNRGETAAAIDVTPATTTTAQAASANEQAQANAAQTSGPQTTEDQKSIADLANRFANETDPDERISIADELGLIDSPESIRKILELLKNESDPTVQAALLEAMQGLDALEGLAPDVLAAVKDMYARTSDADVRIAAQDLLGDIATADAAAALRDMRNNPNIDPLERLNAAENLMRMRAIEPSLIPDSEVAALNEQLKLDYQAGPNAAFRSQAIMALAIDGKNNLPFFQQALQTEQDPQVKNLLDRLVRMFSAQPAATPPPGAAITPAPTPA